MTVLNGLDATDEDLFKRFDVSSDSPFANYRLLTSAIAPRPIAVISTIDPEHGVNLSPFSFFNMFSTRPPVLVVGVSTPATGGVKDTLSNARSTGELVVHLVDKPLAKAVSLASATYAPNVDEFQKAGLTAIPSAVVGPPRAAEAPVALECKVQQIVDVGNGPGAGNLIVAEIVFAHVAHRILADAGDRIDPHRFSAVSRLGDDWWSALDPATLFRLPKPAADDCLGITDLRVMTEGLNFTPDEMIALAHVGLSSLDRLRGESGPTNMSHDDALAAVRTRLSQHDLEGAWRALLGASVGVTA